MQLHLLRGVCLLVPNTSCRIYIGPGVQPWSLDVSSWDTAAPYVVSRRFPMADFKCCVTGFEWDGEPTGHTIPFPTSSNQAYVTGSSDSAAILFICDLYGWEFRNNRLLADHLARAVGATVYVPDL